MAALIPLGDASRRPRSAAVATLLIILVNAFVFLEELGGGNRLCGRGRRFRCALRMGITRLRCLLNVPACELDAHYRNMIFLWAFGPAMEDVMGHARYVIFYLAAGVTAMMGRFWQLELDDFVPGAAVRFGVMGAFI